MVILSVGLAFAQVDQPDLDLVEAAQVCSVAKIERALANGADVTAERWIRPPHRRGFFRVRPRGRWTTGLQQATRCALAGKDRPLELLLAAGAPVDLATTDEPPSLHLALSASAEGERRGAGVAERLLAHGARLDATYRERLAIDALYDPEQDGSDAEVAAGRVLVEAGVPSIELLCSAVRQGDRQAVARTGADRNGTCRGGSPLLWAAEAGQMEVVAQLLDDGAPVDAGARRLVGDGWMTPLHVAVAAEHPAVVARLLEAGASPDASAGPAWAPVVRPLQVALAGTSPEVVEALVSGGASRAVWLPPDAPEGPWRTVFDPGWSDLRDVRPLDREEAAVAHVRAKMLEGDAGSWDPSWERAIGAWGPVALSTLWAEAADDALVPGAIDGSTCGTLGEPKDLRGAWGKPDREGGRWAQRWRWDGAEALVTRERFPGRWTVARQTGPADRPCQALVRRTAPQAMLLLGPPDGVAVDRLRWAHWPASVELELDEDGKVRGWTLVGR